MPHTAADVELVQATPAQQADRWRLHHHVWGEGFDLPLYLQREQALAQAEHWNECLRMWLLVDQHGEVLASCETYGAHALVADEEGRSERLPLQTVASVLVAPELRNLGHAATMMQMLDAQLRFEGNAAACLYSDIGPQLYRRTGYFLHAARESVLGVHEAATWPTNAIELGMGDVASVLAGEQERMAGWLSTATAPSLAELPTAARIAWFQLRSQYRAWARGHQPAQVVGAKGPDGGFMLWSADAPEPVLDSLLWRPNSGRDAQVLTHAAVAHARGQRLRQVRWWDADRDTGLDPYRHARTQPEGAVARDRQKALPMLSWLSEERPMPLVWMAIERFGWA